MDLCSGGFTEGKTCYYSHYSDNMRFKAFSAVALLTSKIYLQYLYCKHIFKCNQVEIISTSLF